MLASKLKALKEDLKVWNRDVFGDVNLKQFQLMAELTHLDEKEECRGLSSAEHESRKAVLVELDGLAHLEETSWRQKSRVLWLREGDNNTKYFHKVANSNRQRNYMDRVEVEGALFMKMSRILERMWCLFMSIYIKRQRLGYLRKMGSIFTPLGLLIVLTWRESLLERRCFMFFRI